MNALLQLFNVNTTFFTIFNYPMSYIEFFGTIFNLFCVWLIMRKNILSWPVGLIGVVLFGSLFYQLNLYADLFEQWYYFVTGIIGWVAWAKAKKPKQEKEEIVVERNSVNVNLLWVAGIALFTVIGAWAMARIHLWLPQFFPEPASLPLLDVWTTVMSFAAQIMLIQKRLENWILWIVVDVIAIGLYWYKGVPFVAVLYAILLILATSGLVTWYKTYKRENNENRRTKQERLEPSMV